MTADMNLHSGRSRTKEIALNVGAVLGLICIVATMLSLLFGIKPLVLRSGSMAPAIPTGALALAKSVPADDLTIGDVISVDNAQGVLITHRVIDLQPLGDGTVSATLQGDANNVADSTPYVITEADRVVFHVAGAGYAVAWLSSKIAIFLGGVLAGALLVIAFGRNTGRRAAARTTDTNDSAADAADIRTELQEAHHD